MSGAALTVSEVRIGALIFIKGSGNNNYYVGFINNSGYICAVITNNKLTGFDYDKSSNVLTMPTDTYYFYNVLK